MPDLTSKMKIPSAEYELALAPGVMPMGSQIGGVSAFNNSFKRGYGNRIWGVDERGQWLGKADFEEAPWSVTMEGANLIHDGDTYRAIFGEDGN